MGDTIASYLKNPTLGYSKIGFNIKEIVNRIKNMSKNNYSKEYQHLLEQLKKARENSGLTQKEVSEKLKKPQSYISKCESGERRVDPVELKMFAKIYNKQINYFL